MVSSSHDAFIQVCEVVGKIFEGFRNFSCVIILIFVVEVVE